MDISTILMPVITLLSAQLIVLELSRLRISSRKLMVILAFELLLQTVVCAAILIHFGYEVYAKCFFFVMDLPACITFYCLSKRRDFRDLFTVLVTIFISFTTSIPSMWASQILGDGYFWYNIIRIVFFGIFISLIHFQLRKRYLQIQDELSQGWGFFCILPLLGLMMLGYQYLVYSRSGNFSHVAVICIFILITVLAVFYVFNYILNQLHEKYMIQEQQRLLVMQNKAQQEQFERQKESAEKSNRRWHDLRHNTQQLIELMEAGNMEQALAYLKEQRGMEQVPQTVYCLHPAVNSILCLWAERSKKAGIEIEIQTDVPEKLLIEPMELSALFSNAIENAFEACNRVVDSSRSFIKVESRYNGKRLAISIMNSCNSEVVFENDMPVSAKTGGGIGTRSMAYTVQRFSGTKFFEVKDGVFTARMILNV